MKFKFIALMIFTFTIKIYSASVVDNGQTISEKCMNSKEICKQQLFKWFKDNKTISKNPDLINIYFNSAIKILKSCEIYNTAMKAGAFGVKIHLGKKAKSTALTQLAATFCLFVNKYSVEAEEEIKILFCLAYVSYLDMLVY